MSTLQEAISGQQETLATHKKTPHSGGVLYYLFAVIVVLVHQVGYTESVSDRLQTLQIFFPFIWWELVKLIAGD